MKVFSQLKYLRPAFGQIKGMLVAIALVTVLVSLIALLPPYLGKLLFDFENKDQFSYQNLKVAY